MVTSKHRERYIWLVFLIGSIILWRIVIPAEVYTNQNNPNYGPELIPNIIAIGIIIISGISFIMTFIKKEKDTEDTKKSEGNLLIGIVIFLITLGYAYIIDYIGFILASIISIFLIMWILSVRKWYLYLIMLGLIFLISYIFQDIMYINLP